MRARSRFRWRPRSQLLSFALGFLLFSADQSSVALSAATPNSSPAASANPDGPATFSLVSGREPVTSLDGVWRFHPGDDPRWADPNLDDSTWPLLRSDQPWSEQGYKGLSGFAWYRFAVQTPSPAVPLALLLPSILTSYEVFENGHKIGGFGDMPPHGTFRFNQRFVYRIAAVPAGATIHLSIRVWHDPTFAPFQGGGPRYGGGLVGDATLLGDQLHLLLAERSTYIAGWFAVCVLYVVIGCTVLGLYLSRRSEREYLWFALLLLADALILTIGMVDFYKHMPVGRQEFVAEAVGAFETAASLFFFCRVLDVRRTVVRQIVLCLALVVPLMVLLYTFRLTSAATSTSLRVLFALPIKLWIIALLLRRSLAGSRNARLLLVPTFLLYGNELMGGLLYFAFQLGWHPDVVGSISQWNVVKQPFPIPFEIFVRVVFVGALLAFLIRRFARSRAHEERFTADLEAARTLQQVLIPETLPTLPGLAIETAYHPAQEVGGDFYQVLPLTVTSSGSPATTLIVLGDVAGKGLPAAMTVSLLVGALRALAEVTQSPAEILAGLNRRLLGRGSGFTTCLALSVSETGALILANAGHLAPYRNGLEVATAPALPLGLDPDASFPEQTLQLAAGDRLTLLTDGVPEAAHQHELFGFARTASLSTQSASAIAEAAIAYGQADDITVLSIVAVLDSPAALP